MMTRAYTAIVVFGVLLLFGGCEGPGGSGAETNESGNDPERVEAEPLRFPNSAPSMDALGEGILQAFVAGDEGAMESYRLTEYEHNEVVWPELPASAPEINYPVSFAWTNIETRNFAGRGRVEPWYLGRDLAYERVECDGLEEFETFRVHTDCRMIFRSTELGLVRAALFEDVLERGGGFKIFRYYDNYPRLVDDGSRAVHSEAAPLSTGSVAAGASETAG